MPKQIDDTIVYHAAIDTLLARGYAGATTKRIAQAAGINEATLFRKYGKKAQLITAAVKHASIQLHPDDFVYSGDVAADLLRILQAYLDSAETRIPLFFVIMSEISRFPEMREAIDVLFAALEQTSELITRYQLEGILRVEHPIHTVNALLGPVLSTIMLQNADPNCPIPPVDLAKHITNFLAGRQQP